MFFGEGDSELVHSVVHDLVDCLELPIDQEAVDGPVANEVSEELGNGEPLLLQGEDVPVLAEQQGTFYPFSLNVLHRSAL